MFSDVKVGDIVYVDKLVKESVYSRYAKRFTVGIEVTKVLKNTFYLGDVGYRKSNGGRVGGGLTVKREGVDNSEAYSKYVNLLSRCDHLKKLCAEIEKEKTILIIEQDIDEVIGKLEELVEAISVNKRP